MSLPSLNDYHLAVQNPKLSFSDPELKSATVETTPMGMPKARSGGFAVTYRLNNKGRSWAVRCFHRKTPDLQARYADISRFLGQRKPERFLDFGYQENGIQVNGEWFPIVKMDWKSAVPLDAYLDKHHRDKTTVRKLKDEFISAVTSLEQLGIAHGDLQHGNMLVDSNRITFVDYDGIFVPGMSVSTSNERGHVNFQSPLRSGNDFGPFLDRFSSMVIVLSLEALEHRPDLWNKYGLQDNLIFISKDFIDPQSSAVVKDLRAIPTLKDGVDQLVLACRTPLDQLPSITEFIGGARKITTSQAVAKVSTRTHIYQYPVVDALDDQRIRELTGEVVQVVGRVTDVSLKWSQYGQRYAFINFSEWRGDKRFRIVVWNEVLREFRDNGSEVTNLESMWVTLVGLVHDFRGTPQIIPESMRSFRVLQRGEQEAREMLEAGKTSVSLPALASLKSRNAEILETIRTRPNPAKNIDEPRVCRPTSKNAIPNSVPAAPTGPKRSNREIIESLQSQSQTVVPTPATKNQNTVAQVSNSSPTVEPYVAPKSYSESNAGCIVSLVVLIVIVLIWMW